HDQLHSVSPLIREDWISRLTIERLEEKTTRIDQVFTLCKQHWEKTFWVLLARQLGAPANADAMEALMLRTPLSDLLRHIDKSDEVEAMLFGIAGMLHPAFELPYPKNLQSHFRFLRQKYG